MSFCKLSSTTRLWKNTLSKLVEKLWLVSLLNQMVFFISVMPKVWKRKKERSSFSPMWAKRNLLAMNFNFRYAEAHNGHCYLRFDDTNPEKEEPRYYKRFCQYTKKKYNHHHQQQQQTAFKIWLNGSDFILTKSLPLLIILIRFVIEEPIHQSILAYSISIQLYELAVKIIKEGKAYVCHQTAKEMQASKGGEDNLGPITESPWRNRTIEENLRCLSLYLSAPFHSTWLNLT